MERYAFLNVTSTVLSRLDSGELEVSLEELEVGSKGDLALGSQHNSFFMDL